MAAGFNETGLVFSEDYAKTMNERVLPFLRERVRKIALSGAGQKPISAYRYDAEDPRGTVAVVHGFTECAEKFSELIFSLLRRTCGRLRQTCVPLRVNPGRSSSSTWNRSRRIRDRRQ